MTSTRSANRHMRKDNEGRLETLRPGPRSVLIRVSPDYASTYAGQHLSQMTVNLVARQYEVVNELVLDLPDAAVLESVFQGTISDGDSLRSSLLSLAKAVAGPEINVILFSERSQTDPSCIIHIGSFDPNISSVFCISVVADGWRFDCSTNRRTQAVSGPDSNPLGPYMAACFAASAVFKYLWRINATTDICASLWSYGETHWNDLPTGKAPALSTMPTTYLIGCGAVGAAFAFTLAAIPHMKGDIVAIDPQKSDETNRNRLLTMSYDSIEAKSLLVQRLFMGRAMKVYPYVGYWPDYTADATRTVPESIREAEKAYRYEWVLSCVDRNHHRRAIAAYFPRTALGGSTQDFAAQVAVYSMRGDCECLACNHPVPKVTPTEEVRDALLSMNAEELNNWFEKHDADPRERAAIEDYLRDPNCGGVGQAMLAKLGREGETDWSVGFVSVAAGVLLAAVFIRTVVEGVDATTATGPEYFAWFLRPSLGTSRALRKSVCEICGAKSKQQIYDGLWGDAQIT